MKYLLDTHTLLWIVIDSPNLSALSKELYMDPRNEIFVSMATIWEMAIKSSIGKLVLEETLEDFVENHIRGNDIEILKIELSHILRIEKLPFHHRDPFDRIIIAQQIEDNIPIIGSDKIFDKYGVKRIW